MTPDEILQGLFDNTLVGNAPAVKDLTNEGLALGMGVAALSLLPVGIVAGGSALLSPGLLVQGAGVALLGSVLPFSLEFEALKRIPAHVFGVLMSLEPAIAAVVGLILLREAIGLRALAALALVSAATVGVTRSNRRGPLA